MITWFFNVIDYINDYIHNVIMITYDYIWLHTYRIDMARSKMRYCTTVEISNQVSLCLKHWYKDALQIVGVSALEFRPWSIAAIGLDTHSLHSQLCPVLWTLFMG